MSHVRLGYGVSAWARGAKTGHHDGISVYTQALYARLPSYCTVRPYVFSGLETSMPMSIEVLPEKLAWHALKSACFRHKMSCDVDIFHATDHHIPRLNVPVVATVMDLIPFLYPEWVTTSWRCLKNWLFKESILSADRWITISEYSRQDLVRHWGLSPERIDVTPLGVDSVYFERFTVDERQQVLKNYGLPPSFFLCLGTLQPRKNLEGMMKAHALLPLAMQKQYPLVIVGRYGWGVDTLLPKLAALETQGTLRWLNYLPLMDVRALLQSAIALVFMSRYEGFGLPILEAFASECPVIASNTTSIPEVASNAALLADPDDAATVADYMASLLKDDALSQQLRHQGLLRAHAYTWDACVASTLKVYDKVRLHGK